MFREIQDLGNCDPFGPTGSTWKTQGAKLVNPTGNQRCFSLAVLPDATPETLALFKKHAFAFVTDTQVAWKYAAQQFSFWPWV
jgi:hypothetical protein